MTDSSLTPMAPPAQPFRAMIVAVLMMGVTGLAARAGLQRTWRIDDPARSAHARPEQRSVEFRVDLNTAGALEIASLPGLGPKLAERIVDFRKSHGLFRSVADLDHVSGIGAAILASVKPFLIVRGDAVQVQATNLQNSGTDVDD